MAYRQPFPSEMPMFFNEMGSSSIEIGVAAFDCMGVGCHQMIIPTSN
jgi:hypothetical protein